MRLFLLSAAALWAASALAAPLPRCETPAGDAGVTNDVMASTRVLRRVVLSLTGKTPTAEAYEALLAAPEAGRQALIDKAIDDSMKSTDFYETMMGFAHDWIPVARYAVGYGDSYQGDMAGHIKQCGGGSAHEGAWALMDDSGGAQCKDPSVQEVSVEPWWAPGTTVKVIGRAALTAPTSVDEKGNPIADCGLLYGGYYDASPSGGCGCGPNLIWCYQAYGLGGAAGEDPRFGARQAYEEPARLLAHLVWYDRPLSDLVLGNYTVAPNSLRHLYVRMARQMGLKTPDATATWWKAGDDASPRDPLHPMKSDPYAWREVVTETLNPYLLSLAGNSPSASDTRTYKYDPTTTKEAPLGLPAAGVLTMMGSYGSLPRERVRAARYLETFACSNFAPPSVDQTFPPYAGDPATSGTCMHCHRTLDPAAIFFKRWDYGQRQSYYVPWPLIPGVGNARVIPEMLSYQYPYSSLPYVRWADAFRPNTVMTPVTQAQITANPEVIFLDTMPQSYTLLGVHGDGTMGPLGFGKVVVSSGEFDRCAARRMYEKFVGRPLDPASETRYIDALAAQFRDKNGRKARDFIRYLMTLPEFRRGL